jgi:hypothetical protein
MATIAVNVVIFIPPAVPDGDAPMYIKKMVKRRSGNESEPIGTVLNPTVVMEVIDWKKASINRCSDAFTRGSVK